MLFHVAAGAAFVFGLALMTFLWSERYRMDGVQDRGGRFFYWCFISFGLLTAVTALLSMTPVFGSNGISTLYETHRWCALFATVSLVGLVVRR